MRQPDRDDAIGAHGVHDGPDVVHPFLERGQCLRVDRVVGAVSREGGSYLTSRDGSIVVSETRFEGPVVVLSPDGTELGRRSGAGSPVAVVGEYVYLGGETAEQTTEWNYVTGETRELPRYITAVSEDRTRAALSWPVPNQEEGSCEEPSQRW